MHRLPLVLFASACFGGFPLEAEIRLSGSLDGHPVTLTGTHDGRLVVSDGTTNREITDEDGAIWSLDFDAAVDGDSFIWSPQWTISRFKEPDVTLSSETAYVASLLVSRTSSPDINNQPLAGDFWMKWLPQVALDAVLVVAWMEDDRASRVRLVPVPQGAGKSWPDTSFRLSQSGSRGRMVALLWANGPKSIPKEAIPEEPVYDLVQAMRLDNVPALSAAVTVHGKLDTVAGPLLSAAIKHGCLSSARWVLEGSPKSAAWADAIGRTALHIAAQYGRAEVVDLLLTSKAKLNAKTRIGLATPLHLAAQHGHTQVVRRLVAFPVDRNAKDLQDRTPLAWAIDNGFAEVAELVHRPSLGIDLDRDQTEAVLISQAGQGHSAMVAWLVSKGVRTDAYHQGRTAILAGAELGNSAMLSSLLKGGASLDATSEAGRTALMIAAGNGNSEYVRALLDAGANIDAIDKHNRTALHHAALGNRPEVIRLLLDGGARSDLSDAFHLSALEIAILYGFSDCESALTSAGARVNLTGPRLSEVLVHAVRFDFADVVQGAVAAGWPPATELRPGWTALAVARASRSHRCIQLLDVAGSSTIEGIPVIPSRSLDAPIKVIESGPVIDPRDVDDNFPGAKVFVETIIHSDGSTIGPIARESEFPELAPFAVRSVYAARFAPITSGGKPAATVIRIPVTFPAAADRITPLNEVDEKMVPIIQKAPRYPRHARRSGVEARVTVRFTVGMDGMVTDIKVTESTGPEFSEAALNALKEWRYQPAKRAGKPVAVRLVQPLSFTLSDD